MPCALPDEWHDDRGSWFRSYGNENREFETAGLMALRYASINDLPLRRPRIGNFTGLWAAARMIIPALPALGL